ncbi:hypothetical protein RB614_03330 [Phytohabitans sp. ZYX-F-186]|uniref:MarR family transcriptional regulator n=1 Tax=Phytohabitans maris TaxID=3071409 RepID=A0ABU0ZB09_9ACTN|nr:hypothetical protein [Phytohabitans sp. ZYX-F-186]MDQ7903545.1 hypothetical protein [Phytohabitans sp. ZYX-F-186]
MADNLTPSESALLIVLMAEAREISNPDLEKRYRITLTGASREKLNRAGYVKSSKVGRSFVHVLDDKGWDRIHQELNFDSPRSRALGAALSALHDNLRNRVLKGGAYQRFGEMFSRMAPVPHEDVAVPDDDDLDARIRKVYDSLTPHSGAWLKHTDVRRKLADVPSEALDAAFRLLSQAEDVEMMPESNQKTLTDEDRRNAVRVGGQDTHLIAIGTR